MNHTALSAAHMVIYPQGLGGGDMVKMRLQGTTEDMEWLEQQLSQLPNVQITESSDIYRNKGTSNFFRKYLEIEKVDKENK